MSTKKQMLKSGAMVSAGVLCSRILGFIRDVVIAHFMGTGFMAEAFFVAQRIPNVFRDLPLCRSSRNTSRRNPRPRPRNCST